MPLGVSIRDMVCSLGLGLVLSVSQTAEAAVLDRRQTAAAVQVANIASVENLAVRHTGQILATNMNSPNLYAIDPTAKTSTTAVVVSGASGLSGIGEVAPDVFAVIGSGKAIYTVDFTGAAPKAVLIATLGDAGNLNGLAVFDNNTVLVADAAKGNVHRVSLSTGAATVVLSDPTMAPIGGIPFGIDGIKYRGGVVWYTNIFRNSFYKIPVDPVTAKAAGAATTLWTNLMGDDLCFGPDGDIYVATNSGNSVVQVDPTVGTPKPVASVRGSTSCAFGRTAKDKGVMYVGGAAGVYAQTVAV